MIDRFMSFLLALFLAFLVWLYARSRSLEVLDNVPVPVQIELAHGQAESFDLEVTGPLQVPVSFTGPPSRIRQLRGLLQAGTLKVDSTLVISEDRLNETKYLDTVRVDPSDIHAPPGVTAMVGEGRNRIPVTIRRIVEKRLPVRLEPSSDERVSEVTIEPATVLVRGPLEILNLIRSIPTQAYTLPSAGTAGLGHEVIAAGNVPLVGELEGRPIRTNPETVSVRFTLRAKQKVFELAGVPVHFLCPANFGLRPQYVGNDSSGKVAVRVIGPAMEGNPAVSGFVDLGVPGRDFGPGLYAGEPVRFHLPKNYQLAQDPPLSAPFQLVPNNSSP